MNKTKNKPLNFVNGIKKRIRYNRFFIKAAYRTRILLHDSDNALLNVIKENIRKRSQKIMRIQEEFPAVAVEAIDACNAECIMCKMHSRPRRFGLMEWDLYAKIVDEISQYSQSSLLLNNYGEPLLDPMLLRRIRYAKEKGIKQVHFFSNGILLDEEKSRLLIESGLDGIYISINALHSDTYNGVMKRGICVEQIEKNIKRLIQLREDYKTDEPLINVNFIEMENNSKETRHFIRHWQNLVDFVNVSPVKNRVKGACEYPLVYKKRRSCCHLDMPVILATGEVTICCEDVYGQEIVGDARTQSIRDIWLGKRMQEIRAMHSKGEWDKIPVCQSCDVWKSVDEAWWR